MKTILPLLAAISGGSLISLLIQLLIVGVVLWLLLYIISVIPIPAPFQQVARVIVIIIGVVFLINALLSMLGHAFIVF